MKSVLFVIALIMGSVAMAHQDCSPYIRDTGEGISEYTYPCGHNYKLEYRGCNEGEVAYDSVFNGEGYSQVAIVCHNGTFAKPSAPVVHRGCIEGEIAYDSVSNGEGYSEVAIVCRHGRFVRLNN